MDQTALLALRRSVARWVMSGLVIAGLLAMHVLGGHGGTHFGSMAMTGPGLNTTATNILSMDMPGQPSAIPPVSLPTRAPVPVAVPVDLGTDMSDLSCCVLFLITGAALALLALRAIAAFAARSSARGRTPTGAIGRRRGPPTADPPRFSLCVLRV